MENNDEAIENLVESMLSELEIPKSVKKCSDSSSSSDDSSDDDDDVYKKKAIKKSSFKVDDDDDDDEDSASDTETKTKSNKSLDERKYVKTKDEVTLDDLPAVETINVQLDESIKMETVGQVISKVDKLVIVKSTLNQQPSDNHKPGESSSIPPLDEETILFDAGRRSLGKIYEVFGPVSNPFYSIRFNDLSKEQAERGLELEIGSSVYAAQSPQFTKFIFNVDELRKLKGSDASWSHDNEPPLECLDYSDDEKEREAKRALKKQPNVNKKNLVTNYSSEDDSQDDDDETMVITDKPMNIKKSQSTNFNGQKRQYNRASNMTRSNTYQSYSQPPPPPPPAQLMQQSHGYPAAPHHMYWPPPQSSQPGMAQGSLLGQPSHHHFMQPPPNYHMMNPYMYQQQYHHPHQPQPPYPQQNYYRAPYGGPPPPPPPPVYHQQYPNNGQPMPPNTNPAAAALSNFVNKSFVKKSF